MSFEMTTAMRRMFAHLEPKPEGELVEGEPIFEGKGFIWRDGKFVPKSYNSRRPPSKDEDE